MPRAGIARHHIPSGRSLSAGDTLEERREGAWEQACVTLRYTEEIHHRVYRDMNQLKQAYSDIRDFKLGPDFRIRPETTLDVNAGEFDPAWLVGDAVTIYAVAQAFGRVEFVVKLPKDGETMTFGLRIHLYDP